MANYKSIPKIRCEACSHDGSFYPLDYEHTKTKGSGGTNAEFNICVLCRKCHQLKGSRGVKWMAENYPSYRNWLIIKGWRLCEFRNKWVRDC